MPFGVTPVTRIYLFDAHREPQRPHRGAQVTNFAVLQNAVDISKMQWFGF
jgi:hypothetical protein